MRKSLVIVALLSSTLASTAAFADMDAKGVIKTINMKSHVITLADGSTYKWPKTFKIKGFKVGEKVQLSWDLVGKDRVIDSLKPAT